MFCNCSSRPIAPKRPSPHAAELRPWCKAPRASAIGPSRCLGADIWTQHDTTLRSDQTYSVFARLNWICGAFGLSVLSGGPMLSRGAITTCVFATKEIRFLKVPGYVPSILLEPPSPSPAILVACQRNYSVLLFSTLGHGSR